MAGVTSRWIHGWLSFSGDAGDLINTPSVFSIAVINEIMRLPVLRTAKHLQFAGYEVFLPDTGTLHRLGM